jgi:hypothetical protein
MKRTVRRMADCLQFRTTGIHVAPSQEWHVALPSGFHEAENACKSTQGICKMFVRPFYWHAEFSCWVAAFNSSSFLVENKLPLDMPAEALPPQPTNILL